MSRERLIPDTSSSVELYLLVRVHAMREDISLQYTATFLLKDHLLSVIRTCVGEGSSRLCKCWRALQVDRVISLINF